MLLGQTEQQHNDRLQYGYDNAGRVNTIHYTDSTGMLYKRIHFLYDGQKLVKAERERKLGSGFIVEKTMTFLYYTDGNLKELPDHRHPIH